MKKLADFKEEIHKCSKCGLCQSVCPVYEQTGNDCAVSRGKFIMLNGVIKGDLKLSKNVNKYLDMCLKCNACKEFCPSDIDAKQIFTTAKSEYFKKCPSSFLIKGFQSKLVFNSVLNLTKIASNTYRALKIDKLVKKFYSILQKMVLGKKIILANEFVGGIAIPPYHSHSFTPHASRLTVVYFKGCVNEYINPRTKIAAENVLAQLGVEVVPAHFECCGVPFLSNGNVEQFVRQAEQNLAQIPDDFDYFITDCASCQSAFSEYENYIENPQLLERLKKINEKSINIVDLALKYTKYFEFPKKTSFTFHKPCHLENMEFLPEFLSKAKNIKYIQMNEFDKCCGFSGSFAFKNPKLSTKISAKKAQNAVKTKANYVLTSCPACVLGLNQGLIENNNQAKVFNFIEFIAMSKIDLNSNYQNEDCSKGLFDNFVKKCF